MTFGLVQPLRITSRITSAAALCLAVAAAIPGRVGAQCDAMPLASEFKSEKIADAPGWPYDIVVDKDLKVYWVERLGAFRMYDPATKKTILIKQFQALYNDYAGFIDVENGLEGLAFDNNFASTHWIYVWYTVYAAKGTWAKGALGPTQRLSRFTLKNNNTEVDMASEKPIFEQKIFAQCCHFGGAMRMSKDGLIYLSTGDNIHYNYTGTGQARAFDESIINGDPRNTSSNTNDTRGKILRIKPINFPDTQTPAPGIGATYEIPAGNLKETWASADKDKVRPEIYSMGHRNPFSISVHPEKPWVAIGEANGDNAEQGDDEINLVTKPGNFGWPFLIGDNKQYIPGFWANRADAVKNAASYTNESKWNTGAKTLPPATGSLYSMTHGINALSMQCHGVTWGFVDYDPTADSKVKWPPYLKGKLIVSGYGTSPVRVATLDAEGRAVKTEDLFKNSMDFTTDVLRATQGPDGAFYIARGDGIKFTESNLCRIYKVSYTGSCSTVDIKPSREQVKRRAAARPKLANLGAGEVALPAGMAGVQAYDTHGRLVWESRRGDAERNRGEVKRRLPAGMAKGMLELRYTAE